MAENRICLLLFLDRELAAVENIAAASQRSIQHIGDLLVVQKAYWNQGLGQILVENSQAHSEPVILRKLSLECQVRNNSSSSTCIKIGFLRSKGFAKLVELVQRRVLRCLPYGKL